MLIDPADSAQRSTTAIRKAPAIARILHLLSVTDRQALVVWAFTRAYVFLIALAVGWLLTDNGATAGFFDLFVQWDVHHYWGIAAWGYGGEPTGVPNEAFFPAMPALMWLGATVLPL